jgi:hypothetical protein
MRTLVNILIVTLGTSLLPGCFLTELSAPKQRLVIDTFCQVYVPPRASRLDTELTLEQIARLNRVYDCKCKGIKEACNTLPRG